MAELQAGAKAPDFRLRDGQGRGFALGELLERGPVVVAFMKISCPVCQYAFPYLERLARGHAGSSVTVLGVSQDDARGTAEFAREYGITFPLLLDDIHSYPVSNAYGIETVPTVFFIARDGAIELSAAGWVRSDMEDLNRRIAGESNRQVALFEPGESVADFRAG